MGNSIVKVKEIEEKKENIEKKVNSYINDKFELSEVPDYWEKTRENLNGGGRITEGYVFLGYTYETEQEAINEQKKLRKE